MSTLDLRGLPSALFGSGVARHTALTEWDAAIRGPLATSRRIGFLSLEPGVGGSTLAEQVTRIIAARRADPILAIDVSADAGGLGRRLGLDETAPSETRSRGRTTAEAVTGLTAGDGWFGLQPAVGGGAIGAWLGEAAPITRFFDVSVTDFGVRHPFVDLAGCAALCDVVCIVSDARRTPAEIARAAAPAIAELPEEPMPVLALVDHARRGPAVADAMDADAWPVVGIPFDGGLRAGAGARTLATRHALVRLAATLVAARKATAL
ncbi:MAG: hypothetical protein ABWY55_08280 [Microbacterium sp.]